jgi:hypothetical protein
MSPLVLTRSLAVLVLSVLSGGCYARAAAGYARTLNAEKANLGHVELAAGAGDFREPSKGIMPSGIELSLALDAGRDRVRGGVGGAVLWAPLAGWDHDVTPTVRAGARLLQRDWTRSLGPSPAATGFVEVGLLGLMSKETRSRSVFTLGLGAEYTKRLGTETPPGTPSVFLLLGYGYSTSVGPTS